MNHTPAHDTLQRIYHAAWEPMDTGSAACIHWYVPCNFEGPMPATIRPLQASCVLHYFFIQRIWLCCPTASWWQCISCGHASEYARGIILFYDKGLYRYSTYSCIRMPLHAGQQETSAFSTWWGVCIGLWDKQVPPHSLWAAFCLRHQLLCTEIYLIIWWKKSGNSLTSDEVHVLGYGCQALQQPLSCWRQLFLSRQSWPLLGPSFTRLHSTSCSIKTSQPSTNRNSNCTQTSAVFLWPTCQHTKGAFTPTTSNLADSNFHWWSYGHRHLWFPASIKLAGFIWYHQA